MTTEENYDESCTEKFGFELKEAYKIALKFYKGKKTEFFFKKATQVKSHILKFK